MKLKKENINLFVIDMDIPKVSARDILTSIVDEHKYDALKIVVVRDTTNDQDFFVNEILNGRLAVVAKPCSHEQFIAAAARVLSSKLGAAAEYQVRKIECGEVLFREGDEGGNVYLVKSGILEVERGGQVIGEIKTGEFAGEMAHINKEPRSATVTAKEDSELIEIPPGQLDTLLFTKPNWSKALMMTLSKRLKTAQKK
jgi:CRP/FNR family transcriptional regulator, cyclic AMP receptor protein